MSDQLPMFDLTNCEATGNVTSSPAADSGPSRSGRPGGPTTDQPGAEAAPVQVSARPAKEQGLATLVTSGRIGFNSSRSFALQSSLANRLVQRLDTAGSTLFNLTWRERTTPLGRRYLERAASGRRTSGNGFTSVPTPQTADMTGGGQAERALMKRRPSGAAASANLNDHVMLAAITTPSKTDGERGGTMTPAMSGSSLVQLASLASVPTPMAGSPATETYNAAGNTDYSRRIVELAFDGHAAQRGERTQHGEPRTSDGSEVSAGGSGPSGVEPDATSDRRGEGRPESAGQQGRPDDAELRGAERGNTSEREGLQGYGRDVRDWRGPGWLDLESARSVAEAGATRGYWGDCDWWYGSDGLYRAAGPGVQPLAHGSPARVGRLRLYGDAICVPAAQAFVEAYLTTDH